MSFKRLSNDPVLNICINIENYPDLVNFVLVNKNTLESCEPILKYKYEIYSYEQDIDEPLDRNIKKFMKKVPSDDENPYFLNLMKEYLINRYYKKIYSKNEIKEFLNESKNTLAYILKIYDLNPDEYLKNIDQNVIDQYIQIIEHEFEKDSVYIDDNGDLYIFSDLNYTLKNYEEIVSISQSLVFTLLKKKPDSNIKIMNDKYYIGNVEVPKSKKWLKNLKEAENKGFIFKGIYQSLGFALDEYFIDDFSYFLYDDEKEYD
jgi:hypothetical protein